MTSCNNDTTNRIIELLQEGKSVQVHHLYAVVTLNDAWLGTDLQFTYVTFHSLHDQGRSKFECCQ